MSWEGFTEDWIKDMERQGRTVEDVVYGRTTSAPARPAAKRRRDDPEHRMQCALVELCAYKEVEYPELAMLFAIPNGGQRHAAVGAKLKAEGARAGVPDLFLAAPAGGFHGLFLELKASGGQVQDTQERWMHALAAQGYCTRVAWSLMDAWGIIEAYLTEEL